MTSDELKVLPELHAAIRRGMYHDVRLIINSGVHVNIQDPEKRTGLITCCFIEQEDWAVGIARMLLEREAKVGLTDRQGRNALMHACIYQRCRLISLFLKAIDYDVDYRDLYGNTALFYAASTGNVEIANVLVEKMLKFKLGIDQLNKWGMSALMEACRLGHIQCANMLISEGASEDFCDRVSRKNAREWLQEYNRTQELSESFHRKLKKRPQQNSRNLPFDVSTNNFRRLPSDISQHIIRSQTQLELKSGLDRIVREDHQKIAGIVRSKTWVCNPVRMKYIQRNWIEETIGENVIDTKFKTCLYTSPADGLHDGPAMMSSITSPVQLPQINHWRGDFGKLYKHFEIFVSSSYRKKAQEVPRPLSRRSTEHSRDDSVKSFPRGQAPSSGSSSTKYLSKKNEASLSRMGSNPQLKFKREDSAHGAGRILANAVRRRNLLK